MRERERLESEMGGETGHIFAAATDFERNLKKVFFPQLPYM